MKKYHLADLHNGIFDTFDNHEQVMLAYDEFVEEGIMLEKEVQYVSGLTDKQIEEKVRAFYCIIEE